MSIACAAVVGKDNDPLYLRTFTSSNPSSAHSSSSVPIAATSISPTSLNGPLNWNQDEGLKFHYFVHTALDAMEEKTKTKKNATGGGGTAASSSSSSLPIDLYLGLLNTVDEYKVYGYTTNTRIKFIVILQDVTYDLSMKQWLRDFHTLYISTVCNPFYDLGTTIQNPTFESNVGKMVANWSNQESKR